MFLYQSMRVYYCVDNINGRWVQLYITLYDMLPTTDVAGTLCRGVGPCVNITMNVWQGRADMCSCVPTTDNATTTIHLRRITQLPSKIHMFECLA